ncbi:MAG: hypothetical protein ABEJ95_01920 [Candidatus Nanohalobium sp.]
MAYDVGNSWREVHENLVGEVRKDGSDLREVENDIEQYESEMRRKKLSEEGFSDFSKAGREVNFILERSSHDSARELFRDFSEGLEELYDKTGVFVIYQEQEGDLTPLIVSDSDGEVYADEDLFGSVSSGLNPVPYLFRVMDDYEQVMEGLREGIPEEVRNSLEVEVPLTPGNDSGSYGPGLDSGYVGPEFEEFYRSNR